MSGEPRAGATLFSEQPQHKLSKRNRSKGAIGIAERSCARLYDRQHLCHPGFLRPSTRGILKGRRGVVEETFLNAVKSE